MPQMMPCSWLMIFLGSVVVFFSLGCNISSFFFFSSFPKKNFSFSEKKTSFWF